MSQTDHAERCRLEALSACAVLDTPPDVQIDRLTRLAAQVCGTPIAFTSFIDASRQWFKSSVGLAGLREFPREPSFCERTIATGSPFMIADIDQSAGCSDHPLVRGEPHVRMYAGVPLRTLTGFAVGSLAVLDIRSHALSPDQLDALDTLAAQIMAHIELEQRREQVEAQRLRLADQLQATQRMAGIGTWEFDVATQQLSCSDEVYAIHEVPRDTRFTVDQALDFYAPEWRTHITDAFDACLTLGRPFDEELQIITARGQRVWVRSIGRAGLDRQGRVVQVHGAFQDISARKRATEETRQLANRLSATLESMTDGVFALDENWCFTYMNREAGRLLTRDTNAVVGKRLWDEFPGSEISEIGDAYRRAIAHNVTVEFDSFYAPMGIWFEVHAYPSDDGLTVYFRDITQRKQLEQEREHEREFLDALLDSLSEGIVACDEHGTLSVFTRVTRDLHGLPEEPLPPDEWGARYNLFAADGVTPLATADIPLFRALRGEIVKDTAMVIAPTGCPPRLVQCNGQAITTVSGRKLGAVVAMRDITERDRSERLLMQRTRALHLRSRCSEALIRIRNEQELLHEICSIAVDVGGYRMAWVGYAMDTPEKPIAVQCHAGWTDGYLNSINLSWDESRTDGKGPAGRVIRGGEAIVSNDLGGDESFRTWSAAAAARGYKGGVWLPLKNARRTFGVLALYADEVRPIAEEERVLLQGLANDLAFGIGSIRVQDDRRRLQSAVLKVAAAVSASSGNEFFEQLVRNMTEALDADAGFMAVLQPGDPPTVSIIAGVRDGEAMPVAEYDIRQTPCEALLHDEQSVIRSGVSALSGMSGSLIDPGVEASVGRQLVDCEGRVTGCLFVLFHRRLDDADFVTSTLRIFSTRAAAELDRQHADARIREQASLLDKAQDAIIVRSIDHRVLYWNKSAERIYGWPADEAIGQRISELYYPDDAAFRIATEQVIATGEWTGEIRQRRKDGSLLTVEGHWTLLTDADGKPKSVLAINTDITHRLAVEAQLEQAQRLEAVGQLTGGVAHDFNNLLTVILGNAELLMEKLGDNDRLRLLAEMTRTAAQRGADLTHRLLAFSRRQALEPRSVDTYAVLLGMHDMLRRTLGENIEIEFRHGPGLWRALVDPSQLEGAVLNLCINARDAMKGGGRLTMETTNAWLDDAHGTPYPDLSPGQYVLVAVSDTGTGIPPEHLARVFEPFFTTKEKGKGTGLGLSMVFGFVKQSRGHVKVYSEVGQGTTVKMYLPRADLSDEWSDSRSPDACADSDAHRGHETVLLVEDDELVRQHASNLLLGLGYTVIKATNGPDALQIIRGRERIDLLFTDVIMPGGMNGPQLVEAAHRVRPHLKVLYTSGYTENAIVHQGRLDKGVHLLNKPYRRAELAHKVRLALSGSR
ncbi:PAS domain S-box protein [Methyloversatilis sp.]|uniref:PAS domain S-box protein n=1 Tax=Methyloversatilis sp. TaxID=2569862 RepID=UPI002734EA35|nr:PAS domain S-box protein [Methyloversatilis sp.]MDP2868857.1 PAS domain S-box protein [Methyloversatilis sp.]MDP3457482.1 PAS domain S-box protein [Methyloversatilis sp.]MDP3579341.1 PAS domain S-box protein [Methyloversatilis sp.]